jgi:hypothetical protein
MSFFSKLFGDSDKREIWKSISQAQKAADKTCKPITEISLAIVTASVNSRDAVKALIEASSEKERQEREIYIFYEFIYFYMHVTMRHAFVHLTDSQIESLQGILGPLISSVAIDSYFAHWPNHLKEKMVNEFYDKLNDAEIEYAQSTQVDSAFAGEDDFAQKSKALLIKLGSNVSALASDSEKDIAIVMPVSVIALREWGAMQLDKCIAGIKAVI